MTESINIEKARRFIKYLYEIHRSKFRIVKNIDEYKSEQVFWLYQIPDNSFCYCKLWSLEKEYDPDIWIEIKLPPEPKVPDVPEICKNWVVTNSLKNKENFPLILNKIEVTDEEENYCKTVYLKDHTQVKEKWEYYLESQWLPWVEKHNEWEKVYKVFKKLYEIYLEQFRQGEQYELILGVGLLNWKTLNNQHIKHPIIIANASIEFESESKTITIKAHQDGAKFRFEREIFYDIKNEQLLSVLKQKLEFEDPFEKELIEPLLKSVVHSLDPNSEYVESIKPEEKCLRKPIIRLAPVIILRKASKKGLFNCLETIKNQIKEGKHLKNLPDNFLDLCEIPKKSEEREINVAIEKGDAFLSGFDEKICNFFFPKPANEEQKRIIYTLNSSNGILVQGPPGTGKSHTIANLICHLLATGQRVLVTAQTSRALKVLEHLIPKEFHPLCIFLLGSGPQEKRWLENSVSRMISTWESYNKEKISQECEDIKTKLNQLKKEKAKLEKHIKEIREAETHYVNLNKEYKGTPPQIARQLKTKDYKWFEDIIPLDVKPPLSTEELYKFLKDLRTLYKNWKELEKNCPETQDLLSIEYFSNLIKKEKEICENYSKYDQNLVKMLLSLDSEKIKQIKNALESLFNVQKEILLNSDQWIRKALNDIVSENTSLWKQLLEITEKIVAEMERENLIQIVDENEVSYPENLNIKGLYEDVKRLKTYLENGGKLGWWIFKPKIVKETSYIFKEVKINNKYCSCSDLNILEKFLKAHINMSNLYSHWSSYIYKTSSSFLLQVERFKALSKILKKILIFEESIKNCRNIFRNTEIPLPNWNDKRDVEKFINSCNSALLELKRERAKKELKNLENRLISFSIKENVHPILQELLQAVINRDIVKYQRCFEILKDLEKKRQSKKELEGLIQELKRYVPRFIEKLFKTLELPVWDDRIKDFEKAWYWAQAKLWLENYIKKDNLFSIENRIKEIEKEIFKLTAQLGSLKAWQFSLLRLQEEHKRHMIAWKQAIKRLGKGTGKYAYKHRKDARYHLEKCREAIPAWVMPLYRLWDTISPKPEMFDVIIVDEASQCGLDSLLLFYIGKKLIIVGDDKQITPEEVGIDRDRIFFAIKEFLHDFEYRDSFYLEEASLFHHAQLRFKTLITLREHFRCMPEIIKFCNDLCYQESPLIPLRQYGSNRLEPLGAVYIEEGYCEGSRSNIINKPEAEAIVKMIVKLCQNSRYKNKTMGVISLLGDTQAKLIQNLLMKELGLEEIEKRRLICGNPYHFQGDERDIIFLSLVISPNHRYATLTKESDRRRFNVAVSRARDQIWLFHSVKIEDLNPNCFRRKLLEFFLNQDHEKQVSGIKLEELEKLAYKVNRSIVKPPSPFESWFEVDVALELLRKGYDIIPQYEIAGKRIDIAVIGSNTKLAIECDGDFWHGPEKFEEDMHRQRQLERCGWEFFRIKESLFYAKKKETLENLYAFLEKRRIIPKLYTKKFKKRIITKKVLN